MTQPNDTPQPATHTPGPWRITGQSCRDYEGAEIGTGNKTVAVILTADAVEVTQEERANSRRIVAAVNACEGISTEALEQGVAAELLEKIQAVAELRRRWRSQDEDDTIDSIEYMDGLDALDLDAVIAKATGRAA
jgi:hypothetical protein